MSVFTQRPSVAKKYLNAIVYISCYTYICNHIHIYIYTYMGCTWSCLI